MSDMLVVYPDSLGVPIAGGVAERARRLSAMPASPSTLRALIGLALLFGCARPGLGQLRDGRLEVEISLSQEGGVRVIAEPRRDSASREAKCPVLVPRASATFNGVAMTRLLGVYAGGDLTYDRDCFLELGFAGETLPAAVRAENSGRLALTDGRVTWSLSIPDAFTPRRLDMLSSPGGSVRRGQSILLRWSPATDRLDDRGIGVGVRRHGHDAELARAIQPITIAGDQISFSVPRDLPAEWAGPVDLVFLGTALVAPALRDCPVRECQAHVTFSVPPVLVTLAD
jgi:hypothetical protein